MRCGIIIFLLIFTIPAVAQPPLESYMVVAEGERYEFRRDLTRTEGALTRFVVAIGGLSKEERKEGTPAFRRVRFVGKCSEGLMALAGVSLHDDQARLLKMMVVPPGGSDYLKPSPGTPEVEWLQEACE